MGFIKTNKTLKKLFHEKDISKIENYFRKIENPSVFQNPRFGIRILGFGF
jgi:hypothetical protein